MNKRQEILELLACNPRLEPKTIATMLEMTEEEVKNIITELEANKTIFGYRTLINWDKANKEHVLALIEVKVTPQRDVGFKAVAERIGRYPEVKTLYLMSGAYDLAVFVEGRTMQEISNFVATKLAPLDGVTSTVTHFVMQTYKSEGIILENGEEDHRLVMSP